MDTKITLLYVLSLFWHLPNLCSLVLHHVLCIPWVSWSLSLEFTLAPVVTPCKWKTSDLNCTGMERECQCSPVRLPAQSTAPVVWSLFSPLSAPALFSLLLQLTVDLCGDIPGTNAGGPVSCTAALWLFQTQGTAALDLSQEGHVLAGPSAWPLLSSFVVGDSLVPDLPAGNPRGVTHSAA